MYNWFTKWRLKSYKQRKGKSEKKIKSEYERKQDKREIEKTIKKK